MKDTSPLQCYALRFKRARRDGADGDILEDPFSSDASASALHFPPGFVLLLPVAMVQLCTKDLGIKFVRVQYGQFAVRLVLSDTLHVLIEVEPHGEALDFIALYKGDDGEARQWLPQVLRVFELAVRLQLWRSGCPLALVQSESQSAAGSSSVFSSSSSSKCGCRYHEPAAPHLPECMAAPLCGQCIILTSLKKVVNTATSPGPHRCGGKGHAITAELMCFTIWAQQAVSTAPAPPNLRRESSLPDRKVLQEQIQVLTAKLEAESKARQRLEARHGQLEARHDDLEARQEQDMDLVGMQFAEADAKVDAASNAVEAKLATERQARQAEREQDASMVNMQVAGVEADMQAQLAQERRVRQQGFDAVQARQDQDMHMVNMQFAETEAKIDATSGTLESRLAADRQARQAEREQDTNMTNMQFAEVEAKLEADRLDRQRATDAVQARQEQGSSN